MERESALPTFTTACRNCGAVLGGVFCAHCGQEHRHDRLRFRDWVRDVLDASANLESRILRTIIELTVRPGRMVAEYVAGRRVPFVSPPRYAIATCALWWFAVYLNDEAQTSTDWWVEYGQLVNLASVPFIALVIQLPFLGSRYNYVETLSLALYITGQQFLLRVGFAVAGLLGANALAVGLIDSAFFLVYTSWALWQFYAGRVRLRALRIFGAVLGILIFGTILNLALMRSAALLG